MATNGIKPKPEELLFSDLVAVQMEPKREYAFHGVTPWRFDFAYPPLMLAIEVEGKGRHQTDKGMREDCEKYNAALALGWKVLRYPASSVRTNKRRERIVEQIRRCVCGMEACEESDAIVLVGD